MSDEGWIRLFRKLKKDWKWKVPLYRSAWIWLLLSAEWKDTPDLSAGQAKFCVSWGKREWGMGKRATMSFIRRCVEEGDIYWTPSRPAVNKGKSATYDDIAANCQENRTDVYKYTPPRQSDRKSATVSATVRNEDTATVRRNPGATVGKGASATVGNGRTATVSRRNFGIVTIRNWARYQAVLCPEDDDRDSQGRVHRDSRNRSDRDGQEACERDGRNREQRDGQRDGQVEKARQSNPNGPLSERLSAPLKNKKEVQEQEYVRTDTKARTENLVRSTSREGGYGGEQEAKVKRKIPACDPDDTDEVWQGRRKRRVVEEIDSIDLAGFARRFPSLDVPGTFAAFREHYLSGRRRDGTPNWLKWTDWELRFMRWCEKDARDAEQRERREREGRSKAEAAMIEQIDLDVFAAQYPSLDIREIFEDFRAYYLDGADRRDGAPNWRKWRNWTKPFHAWCRREIRRREETETDGGGLPEV